MATASRALSPADANTSAEDKPVLPELTSLARAVTTAGCKAVLERFGGGGACGEVLLCGERRPARSSVLRREQLPVVS